MSPAQLRICLLLESAATGVGRHVADLAEELVNRGHEVHVIHSTTNIDSRFIQRSNQLKEQGCKMVPRAMKHQGHVSDAVLITWLRMYLRRNGPFDVLHCHSTKAGLVGRLAAVGFGCKVFYTPHAFFTMKPGMGSFSRKAVSLLEASLAKLSSHVITVSSREGNHASEIGIHPEKIKVIPNGVHLPWPRELVEQRRYEFRRRHDISDQALCIGFIGRLNAQKAVDHLLTSFAEALKSGAIGEVKLLIAGDGPLKNALQKLAQTLNIHQRIHWLGDVNGEEAICAFDIFALASDYEGLPYVVLEALAAGKPIVTTNVGGMDELIDSGINGFVVPPRNVSNFSKALTTLIQDEQLRARMGVASKLRAQQFSVDLMVDKILNLYLPQVQP